MSRRGKLRCETDTPNMHIRARNAFRAWCRGRHVHMKRDKFGPAKTTSFFEHGQLWVECSCGAQWSVCDASGGDSVDGFTFEQVSQGDAEG